MKNMKSIFLFLILAISCKQSTINTNSIIGKWSPTYIEKTKQADGTWGNWYVINTFAALPVLEFTADGQFLRDGKEGADCCTTGNKYSVNTNTITFSEKMTCPTVKCNQCDTWQLELKGDTLILNPCTGYTMSKYVRTK